LNRPYGEDLGAVRVVEGADPYEGAEVVGGVMTPPYRKNENG
jgi:hypothetical protein